MKIYLSVFGALLGIGVCLSGSAPVLAQGVSTYMEDAAAQLISKSDEQRDVIRKSAPVHSQAQLAEYLAKAKESDSPLNLLSPQARTRFVDSLRFNERGVTSFYYADIESELSRGQAYDLLSVFGLQDTLHVMRNIRVSNDRDRFIPRTVAGNETLYDRLANFNAQFSGQSGQVRSRAVIGLYRQLTATARPCLRGSASPFDTDDLFRATAFVEIYSRDRSDVDTLGCLYRQLEASGKATDWHTRAYAGALVTVARYADANALRQKSSLLDLPVLPRLQVAKHAGVQGWRMLLLQDAAHARVESWRPVAHRAYVVVVVHPGCGFSVRALLEIEKRPELQWLQEDLLLLVPPGKSLPVGDLLAWNNAHPQLPMRPMYLRADWERLASLDTPTFYLVRDGEVLYVFEGWPNAKGLAGLQQALEHERQR
ncbi:hypothetical protein ACQR53_03980 [Xanthomonas oryzae]|uniref:hypothetical protein n=2 Tax=Xanthomonas oryzae TaxID=347 RepID=UPI001F5F0444|nr:hypothetical protein [Xanthomonas oryzae]